MKLRLLIGAAGVALALFGVYRLLTQIRTQGLIGLGEWLAGALVIHDGIIAPATALLGVVITRVVRPRARRYVQGGLVAAAAVTVIALPLIHRQGGQPAAKSLLRQDYTANLAILLGLIAAGAALLYGIRVVRDRRRPQTGSAGGS